MGTRVFANVMVAKVNKDPPNIYGDAIFNSLRNEIDQTSSIVLASLWAMENVMRKQFAAGESGKYAFGLPEGTISYPNGSGVTGSTTSYVEGLTIDEAALTTYIKDTFVDAEDPSTITNLKSWIFNPTDLMTTFDSELIQGVQKALFSFYNTDLETNRPWHESLAHALSNASANAANNLEGNPPISVGSPLDPDDRVNEYYNFTEPTTHILQQSGISFVYNSNPGNSVDPGYFSGLTYQQDAVALGDFNANETYTLVRYKLSSNSFATYWVLLSQTVLTETIMTPCGNKDADGHTVIAVANKLNVSTLGLLSFAYSYFSLAGDFEEDAYDVEYGVHRLGETGVYAASEAFYNYMAKADWDMYGQGFNVGYYPTVTDYVADNVNPIAIITDGDTDIPVTEYFDITGTLGNDTSYSATTFNFNGSEYLPVTQTVNFNQTTSTDVVAVIKFRDQATPNRVFYYYEVLDPFDEEAVYHCDNPFINCNVFNDSVDYSTGQGESTVPETSDCDLSHMVTYSYGSIELINDSQTLLWLCKWHYVNYGFAFPLVPADFNFFLYYVDDTSTNLSSSNNYLLTVPFGNQGSLEDYYDINPSYNPATNEVSYTVTKFVFDFNVFQYQPTGAVFMGLGTNNDTIVLTIGDDFVISEEAYYNGVRYYLAINDPNAVEPLLAIGNPCDEIGSPCPENTLEGDVISNPYGIYYPIVPIREDFVWYDVYSTIEHTNNVRNFYKRYQLGKLEDLVEILKEGITKSVDEGGEDSYDDVYLINGCDIYSNESDDNKYLFAHFLGILQNTDLDTSLDPLVRNEWIVREGQYYHVTLFSKIVLTTIATEESLPESTTEEWAYSHEWEDHGSTLNSQYTTIEDGLYNKPQIKSTDASYLSNNVYTIFEKVNGLTTRSLAIHGLQAVHHVEVAVGNNPDDVDALIVEIIPSGVSQVLIDEFSLMSEELRGVYLDDTANAVPSNPFIIPLLEAVINNTDPRLTFYPNVHKRNVLFRSFHLVVYGSASVYVPWYVDTRKIVLEGIQLGLIIYTLGAGGAAIALAGTTASATAIAAGATAEAAATASANAMIAVVFNYGLEALISEIGKTLLKRLVGKKKAARIMAIVAIGKGIKGVGNSLASGTDLIPSLMQLTSAVVQGAALEANIKITNQVADIESTDKIDEEVGDFDSLVEDTIDKNKEDTIVINEDPEEFLFRTTELDMLELTETTLDPSQILFDTLDRKGTIIPLNVDINNFDEE